MKLKLTLVKTSQTYVYPAENVTIDSKIKIYLGQN